MTTFALFTAVVAASLVLLVPGQGSAQERDRAALQYTYETEGELQDVPGARVGVQELRARMGYPLVRRAGLMLVPRIDVTVSRFNFSQSPPGELDVYAVKLPVTTIYRGFPGWRLMASVSPGVHSDFERVDGDDVRVFGLGLGLYEWSESLTVGAGAVYSQDFGEGRVFPAVGLTWRPTPAWEVNLMMPRPRVSYRPSDRWRFFVGGHPAGDEWSVVVDGQDGELMLEGMRVGGGLEYDLADGLWLTIGAGADLAREYEIRIDGETMMETDVDDAFYCSVGVSWRGERSGGGDD